MRRRLAGLPGAGLPGAAVLAGTAGLLVELGLLAAWQRTSYVGFSDGVYAMSSRGFLHGLVPYHDFAAAQPPLIYLLGAGLLALHDGLASLRAGMAGLDLVSAGLVGWCVWRLSGRRGLAWAAALAAPLLPITLDQHAQLVPETLAAPLVMIGAVWAADRRRAVWAGGVLAAAAFSKLAFGVPGLAVALAAQRRRTAAGGLVLTGAALAGLTLAGFGSAAWRQTVRAQLQVGSAPPHYAGGLLAQGAWCEFVLVIGAVAAVAMALRQPELTAAPGLVRTLAAAAGAGLVLGLTVLKRGSYINVLAVAEPPLLALAVSGAAWSWRRWGGPGRVVVAALGALLAAQSASILANPENPVLARRPGARSGLAWLAGPGAVERRVSAARRCPAGVAYSGDPYIAFLAHRQMPGGQPDLFMLAHAAIDASFARRAARDRPLCPP